MFRYNYTVIIPHRNTPDLLERCLKSIPERADIQVLVVDDNSDEQYISSVREACAGRSNAQLIETHEGLGAGYARNVALEQADSKWLLFADADDYFLSDAWQHFDRHLDDSEDVIFFCCTCCYSDTHEPGDRHLRVYNENIYSYANNVRTHDGGTHETGFKLGITKAVNDWATQNDIIKESQKLEGNDIREGLTGVVSVKLPEDILEYEGQTKGKLGSPIASSAVSEFIYDNLIHYLAEHKDFAVDLVKKCQASKQAREAARKAKEAARNGKSKKLEAVISDKLASAQSKDYKDNELFIVEGDSAGGSAKTGRDRLHQAILPLRGKPLNTYEVSMERMLQNQEFSTIIQTIGAGVGADFDIEDAKYGKIIIMTDADTDGAHIQTLLLTFFYNYMKPLITHGMVYIACPPLYRVFKKSDPNHKFVYAWDDQSLEEAKKTIGPGYGINRYKGLGEMNADQLAATTMNKATRQLMQVKIDDPLIVEKRISDLMGSDASKRRAWIEQNIVFNEKDAFVEEVKG